MTTDRRRPMTTDRQIRTATVLYHLLGYPYSEVAAMVGLSVKQVRDAIADGLGGDLLAAIDSYGPAVGTVVFANAMTETE